MLNDESTPGIAFFASPAELGLPDLSAQEFIDALSRLPRDATIFALSRIGHILHYQGERHLQAQVEICRLVGGPFGVNGVTQALVHGRSVFTCDGITRLSYLSLQYCHAPGPPRLTLPQLQTALQMVPALNRLVSGEETLDQSLPDEERRSNARLLMLLLSTSTATSNPQADYLFNTSLGAVALAHAMAPRNLAQKKVLNKLNAALLSAFGGTLEEVYAILYRLSHGWLIKHFKSAEGLDYGDLYDLRSFASLPANSRDLLTRVVTSGSARGVTAEATDLLSRVRSPSVCWPDGIAWRPLYVAGTDLCCWDIRAFQTSLSFHFPRLIDKALIGQEWGNLDALWNEGVEEAMMKFVRLAVPSIMPVRWVKGLGKREGLKLADWCFRDGADLFIIEFKNAALPPGKFADPTGRGLDQWLKQRFFNEDGFCQVYSTISEMARNKVRPFEQSLKSFRGIWPIVVTSTDVPTDVIFRDEIVKLSAGASWMREQDLPKNVHRPLLLGREGFLLLTNGRPAGERACPTRGTMLRQFTEMGRVMENLAPWLHRTYGIEGSAHTMLDVAEADVRALDLVTHRVQVGDIGSIGRKVA